MTDPEWQRLSPWAVVYMFLRGAARFARENLPLLAGAGAGVALIEGIGLRELLAAAVVLCIAGAGIGVIHYRRFQFRIENDALVVRRGLLERSETRVRSDQIQQVMIELPWHLRLFGLVRFSVDTPGGAGTEVELPGIRPDLADELRRRLHRAAPLVRTAAGSAPGTGDRLFHADTRRLLRHGLANNYAWVALAAAMPFLNRLARSLEDQLRDLQLPPWLDVLLQRPLLAGALLLLGLALALAAASVIITLLRFHGFTLERSGAGSTSPRFRQRSGLFSRREQVLLAHRLQVVEKVETPAGRLLGCCHLVCRQIGGIQQEQDPGARVFVVPGLDHDEAGRLSGTFWPGLPAMPKLSQVDRYLRRATWLRLVLPTTVICVAFMLHSGDPRWMLALPVAMPLFGLLAHLRWLAVGWHERSGWLHVRTGLIGRRTAMFPMRNVQQAVVRQTLFQRRRQVADLTVTLASGPVTLPCLAEDTAWSLLDRALKAVEERERRPTRS